MLKTALILKVVGSVLGAVVVAGGGIALADQTGPFSPAPKVTSTAHDGQPDPTGEDRQQGNETESCVQGTAEPSKTGDGSDERGGMPTASSTAMPSESEAGEDNEQGEDCDQGGEPNETATPHAPGSAHDNGETGSMHSTPPQHTPEPTTTGPHD
jgi:hypothetical protein